MLLGIVLGFPVSTLAFLCSPFFGRFTHRSGLLQRALSHLAFLPIYLLLALAISSIISVEAASVWAFDPIGLVNGAVFYLLLFTVSEMVLGKIERSVSLRIIVALERSGQSKGMQELEEEFKVERMIVTRLHSLEQHRYIVQRDGHFIITQKGCFVAVVLRLLRKLFPSGKVVIFGRDEQSE